MCIVEHTEARVEDDVCTIISHIIIMRRRTCK